MASMIVLLLVSDLKDTPVWCLHWMVFYCCSTHQQSSDIPTVRKLFPSRPSRVDGVASIYGAGVAGDLCCARCAQRMLGAYR